MVFARVDETARAVPEQRVDNRDAVAAAAAAAAAFAMRTAYRVGMGEKLGKKIPTLCVDRCG